MALSTTAARTTAVGGSKRGQSEAMRVAAWGALVCQRHHGHQREGLWFWFFSGGKGGSVGGFGFLRGVGSIEDGRIDVDGRRQRQTVSSGAGGSVRGSSGTGGSGRWERGQLEAAQATE